MPKTGHYSMFLWASEVDDLISSGKSVVRIATFEVSAVKAYRLILACFDNALGGRN